MKRTILLLLFLTGIVRSSYAQWQPYLHIADSIAVVNILNAGPFNLLTGPIDFQQRINNDSAIRKLGAIVGTGGLQAVCANGSTTTYQVRFGSIPNQVNIDSNGISYLWGTNNLWSFIHVSNEAVWSFKGYGNSFNTVISSAQISAGQNLVIPNKSGTTDTFAMTSDMPNTAAQYTTSVSVTTSITPTSTRQDARSLVKITITAQAGSLLFNNPTGSWAGGQTLLVEIADNGTPQTLTYGTAYNAGSTVNGGVLPSATITGGHMLLQFMYSPTSTNKFLFTGYANGY